MRHKNYKTSFYVRAVSTVWLVMMVFSCNSFVRIDLTAHADSESTVIPNNSTQSSAAVQDVLHATIDIRIDIAHFFIEYSEDLLGIEGIDDFVEQIELESYLASRDNITELEVTTEHAHASNNNVDSIHIKFVSNALFSTMKSINIPFAVTEDRKIQFEISREFIVSLLNDVSELAYNDIVSIFVPNPTIIVEKDFPEYIAWSFSEYLDDSTIKKMVRDSIIQVILAKGEGVDTPIPDIGWGKIKGAQGAQKQEFSLVSLLYAEQNTLQFLY